MASLNPVNSASVASSRPTSALTIAWNLRLGTSLSGLGLGRERCVLLAWSASGELFLLDAAGQTLASAECPEPIQSAAISDDGHHVVALSPNGVLFRLDGQLQPRGRHETPPAPVAVAISPHGELAVVSAQRGAPQLFRANGTSAGHLWAKLPLAVMHFTAETRWIAGATRQGLLGCYDLRGRVRWEETLMSSIGDLAISGDGTRILATCFNAGLQRYDARGHFEGTYRIAGRVCRVASAYAPEAFAVATTEGVLAVLDNEGHVLFTGGLTDEPAELAIDALGRWVVTGHRNGEVYCFHWSARPQNSAAPGVVPPTSATPLGRAEAVTGDVRQRVEDRRPTWEHPLSENETEARGAALALHRTPLRLAAFVAKSLRVYDPAVPPPQGVAVSPALLHRSEAVSGVGRLLAAQRGLIVACSDRQMLRYSVRRNLSRVVEGSFAQMTEMALIPGRRECIVVEERDRLSRVALKTGRLWTVPLESPVQDLVVSPQGQVALTTDAGALLLFDESGRVQARWQALRPEPMHLAASPFGFVTLCPQAQVLRGHDAATGAEQWSVLLPAEVWRLQWLGSFAVVTTPEGRPYAVDPHGAVHPGPEGLPSDARPCLTSEKALAFVVQDPEAVSLCDWTGRPRWRCEAPGAPGPVVCGKQGVAVVRQRRLMWFAGTW